MRIYLLLFAALFGSQVAAQDQKEREPNNEPDKATIAELDRPVSFQLTTKDDADYFKVISPGDGVIRFTQLGKSKAHGSVHRWWIDPKTGEEVRRGESTLRVRKGAMVVFGVSSDQYSFQKVASDEEVRGEFSFSPELSTSEVNDSLETAESVEVGKQFSYNLMPRLDVDVFRIVSPGDGVLRYMDEKRTETHGWVHTSWALEDGTVTRKGERDIRVSEGQKVYLRIRSHNYDFSSKSSDEVIKGTIAFEPETTASEPNNDPRTAQDVTVGETFSFTLNPRLDQDYFRVISPGRGVLTYVDEKQTETHGWIYPFWIDKEGEGFRAGLRDRRVEKGETVLFGVRSNAYNHSSTGSPEVVRGKFVFAPEISVSEPNGSPESAEVAELGVPVRFTLTPRHDRDFFRLKSPAKGTLRFELASPSQKHRPYPAWINPSTGKMIRQGEWDRSIEKGETTVLSISSNQFQFADVASDEVLVGYFSIDAERIGGEPNDSPGLAQSMNLDRPTEFALTPRHDRDFFTTPPSPVDGMIQIRLIDGGFHHPDLFPWWGDDDSRGGYWDKRVSKGESATLGLRSARHAWGEKASNETLRTMVNFVAEPLGNEPGDTIKDATKVEIDVPISFALMPAGDRDYFEITSPRAGWLSVVPKEGDSLSAWFWWVRTPSGEMVENTRVEVSKGETIYLGVRAGRFRSKWASDEVMKATVRYVAAATDSDPQESTTKASGKRKWTFRINRISRL